VFNDSVCFIVLIRQVVTINFALSNSTLSLISQTQTLPNSVSTIRYIHSLVEWVFCVIWANKDIK